MTNNKIAEAQSFSERAAALSQTLTDDDKAKIEIALFYLKQRDLLSLNHLAILLYRECGFVSKEACRKCLQEIEAGLIENNLDITFASSRKKMLYSWLIQTSLFLVGQVNFDDLQSAAKSAPVTDLPTIEYSLKLSSLRNRIVRYCSANKIKKIKALDHIYELYENLARFEFDLWKKTRNSYLEENEPDFFDEAAREHGEMYYTYLDFAQTTDFIHLLKETGRNESLIKIFEHAQKEALPQAVQYLVDSFTDEREKLC